MLNNLYYVYMKYSRPSDVNRAGWGRWLLIFESRQKADEFYRALTVMKSANGKSERFTLLRRSTAQFWCFDGEGAIWWEPKTILESEAKWNFNVQLQLLNDVTGRDWPIINNVNDGADWLNGDAFFIRNTRNQLQDQYWYWNGSFIEVSQTQRTKFIVRATAMDQDDKQVMIRSDKVTIELAGSKSNEFVGPHRSGSVVAASNQKYEWNFGDIFNSFGTTQDFDTTTKRNAVMVSRATAESWELV